MDFARSFFHWADDSGCGCLTCFETADSPTQVRVGRDRERDPGDSATSDKAAAAEAGGDLSTIADEGLGSISPGGSASGVIDSGGDVDYFSISLVAGQTYSISLQGSGGTPLQDPYLTLANSGGAIVAIDDDGGIGIDSLLTFTASTTGTYQIAAAAYPGSGLTGGYTIDVRQMSSDSVGSTIGSAQSITVGQTTFGFLETRTDVDMFAVTLEAGSVYTIDLAGGADYDTNPSAVPKGELDTLVTIYDSAGNEVAFNDDITFPDDVSSALTFSPSVTGTYYIKVDAYPRQTGGFTLEVNEIDLESLDPLDSIDWGTQLPSNNVTVYFAAAGETFDGVTSLGWSAYEIEQAMAAFQTYADVSNLTFTTTNNSATATFKLVTTNSNQFLGYFNPPGTTNAGVGVFAVNGTGWNTTGGLEQGGYGWITLVHEFGHGLGLAHPHDNGGTSTVMPGVTSPFDSYGVFDLNQGVYTTMSYNDGWQLHPSGTNSGSLNYGYQGGPGAFDIALIQLKYGAASANTGDNVYVLPTANAAGTFWDVIWDTGGIDTIAHTGTVSARLDLTAATLDYSPTGAGVISYVDGIFGGFTIAAGVVIENATGGSGADVLIGNASANILEGNEGSDTLQGNAGDDTFLFEFGDGQDVVTDLESGDIVEIRGYTSAQSVTQDGANVIVILSASDRMTFHNSTVAAVQAALQFPDAPPAGPTTGDDILTGTAGDDTINALAGNDFVYGLAGNDLLDGLGGNDFLYGGDGDDQLDGGAGSDVLDGGAGNDTLDGGSGDDAMTGGTGNDIYRVDSLGDTTAEAAGEGIDTVRSTISWTLAANVDILELIGSADVDGTGNVLDNVIKGNSGANLLAGEDGNDSLYGRGGNDSVDGGAGNDSLYGGDGDDQLDGGSGDDVMAGGTGDDLYHVDSIGDATREGTGEGSDTVRSSVSWVLRNNFENLELTGSADLDGTGNALANVITGNSGANVLSGGSGGADQLYGGGGDDTLKGGTGNDRLEGGAGRDLFYGGLDADSFVFRDGDFAGLTATTCDKINDFSQAEGDTIDLSFVDADTLAGGDQAFAFIGTGAFTSTAGELRYEIVNGNTYVYGDTNGDGAADFMIRMAGSHVMTNGDFVI